MWLPQCDMKNLSVSKTSKEQQKKVEISWNAPPVKGNRKLPYLNFDNPMEGQDSSWSHNWVRIGLTR